MGGSVDRPTEDCFGTWIPEKMQDLVRFKDILKDDALHVSMDDAAKAAYDVVDLTFLNDKYCHFRQTWWDIHDYCKESDDCAMGAVFENMQKNAFNIITQVSTAASIFKQQPWGEMDTDGRAYALNQLGNSVSSLVADLIGFNATKVQHAE